MSRKTRDAVFLCGMTPRTAAEARLNDPAPGCVNAKNHAPMPADYGPWDEIAIRRMNAKQVQKRCDGCGLWALWVGGRSLPAWPQTMPDSAQERPIPTDEPDSWPDVDCGTTYLHDHYVTIPQATIRGWVHGYVGGRGFDGPHKAHLAPDSAQGEDRAAVAIEREAVGGMGYRDGDYGHMEPVCRVCGTANEYAVDWPCWTRQALDALGALIAHLEEPRV